MTQVIVSLVVTIELTNHLFDCNNLCQFAREKDGRRATTPHERVSKVNLLIEVQLNVGNRWPAKDDSIV